MRIAWCWNRIGPRPFVLIRMAQVTTSCRFTPSAAAEHALHHSTAGAIRGPGTTTAANAARCGQVVITAVNSKQSIDNVTVTIGGKAPTHVAATGTIQQAIDDANPGDLIIVAPTCMATGATPAAATCSAWTSSWDGDANSNCLAGSPHRDVDYVEACAAARCQRRFKHHQCQCPPGRQAAGSLAGAHQLSVRPDARRFSAGRRACVL